MAAWRDHDPAEAMLICYGEGQGKPLKEEERFH